ncbi:Imm21 family immunity protein [Streptomyces roseofulvus]|uniref:Imm21 family immunity protein n=1 Tax=Streptomyces TaxID=1883 RepID=UPI003D2F7BD2
MGGPLIVVPVSSLASWGGCTAEGLMAGDATAPDDYDRACAVDGPAGVIPVDEDGAQALVLADEPATSCYLPEHRAFLRWLAADSEAGLRAAADAVLADPATVWEECGTWDSDGPAVLMDSAEAGSDLGVAYPDGGMPAQAPVPLPAGRWRVRATQTEMGEEGWVGLVHLLCVATGRSGVGSDGDADSCRGPSSADLCDTVSSARTGCCPGSGTSLCSKRRR